MVGPKNHLGMISRVKMIDWSIKIHFRETSKPIFDVSNKNRSDFRQNLNVLRK